jgi:hypothetical protein
MVRGWEEVLMASVPDSAGWSVEQLLATVEQLSPEEAALVRAARSRLPAQAERRLRRLIARSERGQLTAKELADYQSLAQQAQQIDVIRAEALAELARRRGAHPPTAT